MKITDEMINSIEFNEIGKDEDGNYVYELKADPVIMEFLQSRASYKGLTLNKYIIDILQEAVKELKGEH